MSRPAPFSVFGLFLLLLAIAPLPRAAGHPGIHEQEAAAESDLAAHPEDPERHLTRGRVHAEKGEWDAALASYDRARRLGASGARVDLLCGAAYLDAQWPHMARASFEGVLGDEPGHPTARLGRARAWMQLDHPEEAAADYRVAVARLEVLQPGYVLEYRDALAAAGAPADALGALDRGMERLGQVPSLQLAAIDTQVEAAEYDDALRRLDLLLARSPGHPTWSARRGEILERAGRTEEARLAYVDALENIRSRTSRRRSLRLEELEGRVRAALARQDIPKEATP